MNLTSPTEIKILLSKYGFRFSKSLGQNFLIDNNTVLKIIEKADIKNTDNVLEIGPGIGTLTREIAKNSKKVLSIEVDETLKPILKETILEFENAKIIYSDILKLDLKTVTKENFGDEKYKVIANLPYYITTPILEFLLKSKTNIDDITVMVQKEVAERMTANPGNKSYGSLSVYIKYFGDAKKVLQVPKTVFIPRPDVDSAVVKISINEKYQEIESEELEKVLRAGFGKRRKTILNSFSSGLNIEKEEMEKILEKLELQKNLRAENLSIDDFIKVAKEIRG